MIHHKHSKPKNERAILKATGSVLFAIIASSHHWLHTLLIALGLTTLGAGILALPPAIKLLFLLVSFVLSISFLFVVKRKWSQNRPAAWVYLISSLISILLVIPAFQETLVTLNQNIQKEEKQELPQNEDQLHEGHVEHSN